MQRVLIVVPAWNEQAAIGGVLDELRATLPSCEVLVVDDGSTDRTSAVAREHGARALTLPYNLGVGGARRAGYRYAQEIGADVVVQIDADGQHDPAYIPVLLRELENVDVVIGARFAGVGDYTVRGPRRWAMRVLAASLSRQCHTTLTDVTSGMRATNRTATDVYARSYPAEYLGDTVESLTIAAKCGLRVVQVPVAMRPRSHGDPSHSPLRAAVYLGRSMLALLIASARRAPDVHTPSTPQAEVAHR